MGGKRINKFNIMLSHLTSFIFFMNYKLTDLQDIAEEKGTKYLNGRKEQLVFTPPWLH
jgi:hypothetical protein